MRTLKETLKTLEDKGFKLSKRTFEYYQSLSLLPKPEKQVGKKGRGLYGFYDSETILKAVRFIFTLKGKGVPLDKIKEEADKSVISQFRSYLKRWGGFSDYSLPEMKSSGALSGDWLEETFMPNPWKAGPGIIPVLMPMSEILGSNQELTKEERTFFEADLIAKARWWETDKIEALALEHINNEAKRVLEGILVVEQYFRVMGPYLKIDSNTIKKILETIEKRLEDIYLLMTMVDSRLAEIKGVRSIRRSAPYWKRLSERFSSIKNR